MPNPTDDTSSTQSAAELPHTTDVSVIIPVYNCEKFIEETIGSVRDQTIGPGRYEIVAVDDGSTDSSLSILTELAEDCSDLHVFTIPNSGSAAAPRNRGVEAAVGRYLFFLDADDKLAPDALERLVETADATGSGVVLCKLGAFGEGKVARAVPSRPFGKSRYAVDFIESKANSTLSVQKLFRRSIVEEHNIRFPIGFAIGEDQPFAVKAFLHSPHVSILADKPYYWLRARGDGTNITSKGQTPRKHLDRISSLITTIVENTEPGLRRDVLLRRPIVGRAGTLAVFGRKMLPAHGRTEREEMLAMYRNQISTLWNHNIRRYGAVSSQVLVDLIIRNDLNEIERVSELLRTKGHLPLSFDWEESEFTYVPSSGAPIGDLNITLDAHLSRIKYNKRNIELAGYVGIQGASEAAYSAKVVMRHRQSGTEVPFNLDASQVGKGPHGVRTGFRVSIDSNDFPENGVWDTFIRAHWGTKMLLEDFGHSKSKSVDTQPVLLGNPTHAAALFTPSGNFALDVGPTAVHLSRDHHIRPTRVGRFVVGKDEITELQGVHSDLISATVRSKESGKTTEVRMVKHQGTRASVVVPRAVTKKSPYTIFLHDADDKQIKVAFRRGTLSS